MSGQGRKGDRRIRTHRHLEEHVRVLIQILKPARVVREPIAIIRGTCVPQEDTLDLAREILGQLRIVLHDIAVAGVCHQDEFAFRESLKDLVEQEFADAEGRRHVAEVQGPGVKGAAGVGFVDEVHVVAGDLLGGRGEVVEVEVRD